MKKIWQAIVKFFDDGAAEFVKTQRRRVEAEAAALGGRVVWEDIQ